MIMIEADNNNIFDEMSNAGFERAVQTHLIGFNTQKEPFQTIVDAKSDHLDLCPLKVNNQSFCLSSKRNNIRMI